MRLRPTTGCCRLRSGLCRSQAAPRQSFQHKDEQQKRSGSMNLQLGKFLAVACLALSNMAYLPTLSAQKGSGEFQVVETSVDAVHAAMKSGNLTSHQLVQLYLDRIAGYDKSGPTINCIITLNPKAMEEADRLDAEYKKGGFIGPLHGIPILVKDQVDAAGMPTTLGT